MGVELQFLTDEYTIAGTIARWQIHFRMGWLVLVCQTVKHGVPKEEGVVVPPNAFHLISHRPKILEVRRRIVTDTKYKGLFKYIIS